MTIVLFSVGAFLLMVACQGTPLQYIMDPISPLLTAVACTRTITEGMVWILCMALVWAAFLGVPWTALVCIWIITYFGVRSLIRHIEWQRSDITCTLTIFISLFWHLGLLVLMMLSGRPLTLSLRSFLFILSSAVIAGILCALFSSYLLHAQPRRHTPPSYGRRS